MIAPRWRKTLRDLWGNRGRTLVVVLAVAVGVCGVGSVLTAYTVLTREMAASFSATKPASAVLSLPAATLEALAIARAHPGVADVEARGYAQGRIRTGPDAWRVIDLFVVPDFGDLRVSLVAPDTGRFEPGTGEVVLERSSLKLYSPTLGQDVTVRANGVERNLGYVGTVHDAGEAPAWMEGLLYGYVTQATAKSFGLEPLTEIRLRAEGAPSAAEISQLAYGVKQELAAAGIPVTRVEVLEPGVHPHSTQMKTLLFLLEAFGIVALVLSCVLVAALVSSMLARQVREIGAMKAVGATSAQVAGVYAAGVAMLGVFAVALGIPLAVAAGRGYATFAMGILNFEIVDNSIPLWVFAVEIAVGILTPLLAAAVPLVRGAAVTVREAVTDTGITAGSRFSARLETLVSRVRGLGRPALLAVRNTVRRPGRLALAVATLAIGGAGFMAAMSAGASWTRTVDAAFEAWGWDLDIALASPSSTGDIRAALGGVEGIASVELWSMARTVLVRADGTDGDQVGVLAPPVDSSILHLPILSGRWLKSGDTDAVVVTHILADKEGVGVGDRISLRLADGKATSWQVVGVAKEIGGSKAYVPLHRMAGIAGTTGKANLVRIASDGRDKATVAGLSARVDRAMEAAQLPVALSASTGQSKQSFVDHIFIFVSLLTIMSTLIVIVGGLGLVSTMSVNVIERVRELGVMQAIGATTSQIVGIVVAEGVAIGLLSWLVAVGLSVPLADAIARTGGDIFIKAPLESAYSVTGAVIWLGIVLVLGAAASAGPALRATRRAVRETLAYQ